MGSPDSGADGGADGGAAGGAGGETGNGTVGSAGSGTAGGTGGGSAMPTWWDNNRSSDSIFTYYHQGSDLSTCVFQI